VQRNGQDDLYGVLTTEDGQSACEATRDILEKYVELQLSGEPAEDRYPIAAIHLQTCSGCGAERKGLLEAVLFFGDVEPR